MRHEFAWWLALAMSAFALFFPHLAAGGIQDPGPLRLMALAVFLAAGLVLADYHFLGLVVSRPVARP